MATSLRVTYIRHILCCITRILLHLMLLPFAIIFVVIFFSFALLLATLNTVDRRPVLFIESCGFSGSLPLLFYHVFAVH